MKLNNNKKREYYRLKINDAKNDGKKLWRTLNNIMGRNSNMHAFFIETDGTFITKPYDIANYFNNYFISKVDKLRNAMCKTNDNVAYIIIKVDIIREKQGMFVFQQVVEENIGHASI